jgi:NAD-dependent deacetylase
MAWQTDIEQAADQLRDMTYVAVSSGAGISAESGVPTFREAQTGLWERFDASELATPQAFAENPNLVWAWYRWRYNLIAAVEPNPGHYAVADLEDLFPQVVVLTQNIDGLHTEAGSSDIAELHGNIRRSKCSAACQGEPTLIDLNTLEHDSEHAPTCPHCGAFVRPDVVWFGESLPRRALDRAIEVAGRCDAMLVIGTSGIVQPAASLPVRARQNGALVVEVNPEATEITPVADLHLEGPSGEVLPELVRAIRRQRRQSGRGDS